jgi:hypothetical protein
MAASPSFRGSIAAAVACSFLAAFVANARGADAAAPAIRPKLRLSRETTRILGPLRRDGYVDYAAALNQRLGKGATPENNAIVLMWEAFGPKYHLNRPPDAYFKALGMPRPADKGRYFLSPNKFLEAFRTEGSPNVPLAEDAESDLTDEIDDASRKPWSKREFPLVDVWLGANRVPLSKIVAATRRTAFFDPIVAGDDRPLLHTALGRNFEFMNARRALLTRSMFHLNEGRIDEAWDDIIACRRLGQFACRGPFLVDHLIGLACARVTDAHRELVFDTRLTAPQISRMRRDVAAMSAMPAVVDIVDVGERYFYLDMLAYTHQVGFVGARIDVLAGWLSDNPLDWIVRAISWKPKRWQEIGAKYVVNVLVDWNETLRVANYGLDQVVAAGRIEDARQRLAKLDAWEAKLERISATLKHPATWLTVYSLPFEQRRKLLGRMLGNFDLALLMSAYSAFFRTEEDHRIEWQLVDVALAIAAYRVEQQKLPAKLSDLVPKYLAAVPKDAYRDGPLVYKVNGKKFVLYSVGADGKDDGGKSRVEAQKEEAKKEESDEELRYDIVFGSLK